MFWLADIFKKDTCFPQTTEKLGLLTTIREFDKPFTGIQEDFYRGFNRRVTFRQYRRKAGPRNAALRLARYPVGSPPRASNTQSDTTANRLMPVPLGLSINPSQLHYFAIVT